MRQAPEARDISSTAIKGSRSLAGAAWPRSNLRDSRSGRPSNAATTAPT